MEDKMLLALKQRSNRIRLKCLDIIHKSKASHIGSSLSCIDILNCIYSSININKLKSYSLERDRVILSKGHAVGALTATLNEYGLISDNDLYMYGSSGQFITTNTNYWAPYNEFSTGSLGQGLSLAVGVGYGLKTKNYNGHVYVIIGDGELNEGSNWEALLLCENLKLNNLTVILDKNNLSGIGNINNYCSLNNIKSKFESFSFFTQVVDGHNISEVYEALHNRKTDLPSAIICNTVKGKGVSFMENNNIWHYRPVDKEMLKLAQNELLKIINGEGI